MARRNARGAGYRGQANFCGPDVAEKTEEEAPAWDREPPKAAFHLVQPRRS